MELNTIPLNYLVFIIQFIGDLAIVVVVIISESDRISPIVKLELLVTVLVFILIDILIIFLVAILVSY